MSIFRFKQFELIQSDNVFKIGTDAVLLGALANHQLAKNALEIGSGTGIISLMLAQRFAQLNITSVDISEDAFSLTSENFQNSPFSDRLNALQIDATLFTENHKFDLIVSNPPYFNQSTLSSTLADARHTQNLSHKNLALCCSANLNENGSIWIILPPKEMLGLEKIFQELGIYPVERYQLQTRPTMPITRQISCFRKTKAANTKEDTICMRNELHEFSSTYIELTREFHPFF